MRRDYAWAERLSEGRLVGAVYSKEYHEVVLHFSRRLTPEFMGEYRSISDLNKNEHFVFELSENKRSLIATIVLPIDSAMAIKKSLNKITPAIKFNELVQNVAYYPRVYK